MLYAQHTVRPNKLKGQSLEQERFIAMPCKEIDGSCSGKLLTPRRGFIKAS